jgi:oligogalacturonide lyase
MTRRPRGIFTRRALLALLPRVAASALSTTASVPTKKKARPLPVVGEFVRFADPTTEAVVVRLTNPKTSSILPARTNRFISVKDRFLVFSSDRTGRPTPFQVNLRTGALHQIGEPSDLLPHSLCLEDKERFLYLIDGSVLKEITLTNRKVRIVAEDVSAFSTPAGAAEMVIVRRGRLEPLTEGAAPLADNVTPHCWVRPGGGGCLFQRETADAEQEFWYAPLGRAAPAKPVLLAQGRISNPFWSPDGQSLLFLRDVEKPNVVLSEIHEVVPESGVERCVDPTSQFAAFSPNGDASVFVGASRSKAQPTVILLLRSPQRELTLCEHRASHPADASPVFSPDSRRVYFQSDHQGKPALYSVNVELLVDPT